MRKLMVFAVFALLLVLGCACAAPGLSQSSVPEASCAVEMMDVGQGLCILVEMDGRYLLYDGGGRETSSLVVRHLRDLGIRDLDLMVASHYDEDHISGLIGVLSDLPVDRVIAPSYRADTGIYRSFREKLSDSSTQILSPHPGDTFSLGKGEVTVLGPAREDFENENDRSVAVLLRYGEFRCLITGDAESEAEREMAASGMSIRADLYVAGHHGSSSSSSRDFLRSVRPKYVFISCGAGNSYGHPSARALQNVKDAGAEIFRTDLQGSVKAYSDGREIWFSTEPCLDWTPGTVEQQTVPDTEETGYILNRRTMRFHRPDCESVQKMNPENRIMSGDSRENLISRGYRPCGVCRP